MVAIIHLKGKTTISPYRRKRDVMRQKQKPLRDKILAIMQGLKEVTAMKVIGELDAEKVTFSVGGVYKALDGMANDGLVSVDEGQVLNDKQMLELLEDSMSNDVRRHAKVHAVKSTSYTLTQKGLMLLKMQQLAATFAPANPKLQKRWVVATRTIEQGLVAL